MTWQQLQATRRVQPHTTSKQELDGLRALVERDLKDAAISALSTDRRFATAYNPVLQLAKMTVACVGYRVTARQGHHQTTLQAVELAMGQSVSDLAGYFDLCRRKRNQVDYDAADIIADSEANELLEKAREFKALVGAWIARHHSHLAP